MSAGPGNEGGRGRLCKSSPSLCGLSGSADSARGLLLRVASVEPRGVLAFSFPPRCTCSRNSPVELNGPLPSSYLVSL